MQRWYLQSVSECYRGRNVRVFRLDREGTLARLRRRADNLLTQRPDVIEVRLFGSLAHGTAGPGSDADLFIVVRNGAPRFLDRIPDLSRYFEGVGIGCDVIAYTEAERDALVERRDAFAVAVLDESIVLARRHTGDAAAAE
ncbi:MAG: polymerase, beta domain protein region [Deltaproteobacteria bacterium]|nr:polymerase, beta domain protein region [Deltaproteobacteria bacterium]